MCDVKDLGYDAEEGIPWFFCWECGHIGPATDLDAEGSTLKCDKCGSKAWEWT